MSSASALDGTSIEQIEMGMAVGGHETATMASPTESTSTLGSYAHHPQAHSKHLSSLTRGFGMLSFAATFIAAVQAQVMSNVSTYKGEDIPLRVVDALYLSGLILDIMSASLAFLTSRWLQRLDEEERAHLEERFERQNAIRRGIIVNEYRARWNLRRLAYTSFSMSLFVPMPLLVIGVVCMIVGLLTAEWSKHPIVVAVLVTLSCVATFPFLVGVLLIGQDKDRRRAIITRLSEMQGDW